MEPTRRHDPNHPLADANGDVWEAGVDTAAELIDMVETAGQRSPRRYFYMDVVVKRNGRWQIVGSLLAKPDAG